MCAVFIFDVLRFMMCPNMFFGMKIRVKSAYNSQKMAETLHMLEEAHPFLKSNISREDNGKLLYEIKDMSNLEYLEGKDASDWEYEYKELTQEGGDVYHEKLLKIVVYPLESEFEVLFISHHLLADGRGILGLACEFADCYVENKKIDLAEEHLLRTLNDLPEGSDLSYISKMIIDKANKNWKKENHQVIYEDYLKFEKIFISENPIHFEEEVVTMDEVSQILKKCRDVNISINDYLVAEMMCKEGCNKEVS